MSTFSATCSYHEQPAPHCKASASQHISTSAQPTTGNQHHHHNNNHQQPNQQQMHSHKKSNNTSHNHNSNNSCNTQHEATYAPALALKKKVKGSSNYSCGTKERHMTSNSMETSSLRQVTQGPQSPPSGRKTHARHAEPVWFIKNIDNVLKLFWIVWASIF